MSRMNDCFFKIIREGTFSATGINILCRKPVKRFGSCFITFVGISVSWVAFFMSSLFISFEISSTATHVKEKLASFSVRDTILLIIEILGCFWYFLIAFSNGSEMLETLLRYCWSISIPRFGAILTKKVLKIFAFLDSILINRSF